MSRPPRRSVPILPPARRRGRRVGFATLLLLLGFLGAGGDPAAAGEVAAGTGATAEAQPFRSDVVEIRLRSPDAGPDGYELEYKVRMRVGATLVYALEVTGIADPEEFYAEFHGETEPGPGAPTVTVIDYRKETGLASYGALTAPVTGIHGWYLQNQSGGTAVVRIRLAGFYDLIPPGQDGNLAGILPAGSPP
ncbi:hypothetical protein [Prosthecomicrobium sp. N25]|uniref:hypothetical protein n=1 Tax=Prosthecomicrobium sp. N25 TaxID=3129254 RepID=UPI003077998E